MKNIEDEKYYSELQAALRSYDTKLWQIPALFFTVTGLVLNSVLKNNEPLKNSLILFLGSLFLSMLILLYNKGHIFNVSIQKKVNEFDNKFNDNPENKERIKRIPLISMTDKEFEIRINGLERKYLEDNESNEGAKFGCIQILLAKQRVSSWVRNIMLLILAISFLFSIYYFSIAF